MTPGTARSSSVFNRHPSLLDRDDTVLIVIDMQEPFLAAIHAREALTANVVLLCRAAGILGIPILATEQYTARMGPTVTVVRDAMATKSGDGPAPIDKLVFSAAGSEPFCTALSQTGRRQTLLCGVETHICISQTAHDLLHIGYSVHIAADAASSRTLEKHKLGMERIRDAGIKPCATEAAVYEWLGAAGTTEFKEILALVR